MTRDIDHMTRASAHMTRDTDHMTRASADMTRDTDHMTRASAHMTHLSPLVQVDEAAPEVIGVPLADEREILEEHSDVRHGGCGHAT